MEATKSADVRQHPFTLRFDPELEREYQRDYARRNAGYARAAFGFGIVMYMLFGYLDYLLSPDSYPMLWLVRLGLTTPLLLGLLAFTFTRLFESTMQPVLGVIGIVAAASVDVINAIAYPDVKHVYFFGVIIANMYVHTFGRVQWAWAVPVGIVNVAVYELSLLFVDGVQYRDVVAANYLMISALVLGMVANYTMEHMSRREFLRSRQLIRINAELHVHSRTDPLTGLPNRRGMLERLIEQAALASRHGRGFVVALVDADNFKTINDAHGHAGGDEALRSLAACMREFVRASDVVARWGGEEFIILFPDTGLEGAGTVAERLRGEVCAMRIAHAGRSMRLTVTVGLAEAVPGEDIDRTLRRADEALYEGKRMGRNQVVLAPVPEPIIGNEIESSARGAHEAVGEHAGTVG